MFAKILEINNSINEWYRVSKLPKWIKKIVAKKKRKKLIKYINKFSDPNTHKYTCSNLYMFLLYCCHNEQLPFMYIESIGFVDEIKNPFITAHLKFSDINDKNKIIIHHFIINKLETSSLDLKIVTEIITKKKRQSTTIGYIHTGRLGFIEIDRDKCKKELYVLVQGLNLMIAEMIKVVLKTELERAERIYEI